MKMAARLIGWTVLLLLAATVLAYFWIGRDGAISEIARPAPGSFAAETVERGRILVSAGNCEVCHTSQGGAAFAGGRPLETPFGIVNSTNITPDPETGIGAWSLPAFNRAMREGVGRTGENLYPVFPYTHFAKVRDDDLEAIYAYLMTREAASATAPANELTFPTSFRPFLGIWKLLYHDRGIFVADPERGESWNRGAYLVQGLGHCSACHGARNALGGIVDDERFSGGMAEGWRAFALDANSPAPVPWSDIALVNYMLDGWDLDHGVAAGPMQPVVNHFRDLSEDDAFAVAEYILSLQPEADEGSRDDAIAFARLRQFGNEGETSARNLNGSLGRGSTIFRDICRNCHRAASDTVPLGLTSTVNAPDPRNVIHILLNGIDAPEGSPNKSMRGFGATLDDSQIADLAAFMRYQFTGMPAWTGIEAEVARIRGDGQ